MKTGYGYGYRTSLSESGCEGSEYHPKEQKRRFLFFWMAFFGQKHKIARFCAFELHPF
jgi:hypothetical protein